jgi:peptide/nickel transport system substrate-binding protein
MIRASSSGFFRDWHAKAAAVALILAGFLLGPALAADGTPRRGGEFAYGVSLGEPNTYDCHAAFSGAVLYRIAPHYSTLLKINPKDYPNIIGDAAESWHVSQDGLTYDFKLRPGIKFHDGTTLTSADVKATYERLRNPPTGVISMRQQQFSDIAAIETADERSIRFRLARPNASMLVIFASPWNCLYSAAQLGKDPTFPAKNILGTGPFRFAGYVAGAEWKGERFDGYYKKGQPYLDSFRAFSMTPTNVVNALAAGQIATDWRGVSFAERDRILAQRKMQVFETAQTGMLMVTFNTERTRLNDARVRRALSLAIDRWGGAESMGKLSIYNVVGSFQRPGSPFAFTRTELQQQPGFRPDMAANRAEARRLLAEAGASDLQFTFLNRPLYSDLGVFLIDQWRQIGVTVTQDLAENARFFASRGSGNFDVIMDGTGDYVDDPGLQFVAFLSFDKNKGNTARVNDRAVDDLYARQASTMDATERRKIVHQLDAHMLEQAFTVPLYWSTRVTLLPENVKGYSSTPSSLVGLDLADIWFAP